MGTKVTQLDKSGWSSEVLARSAAMSEQRKAWIAAKPAREAFEAAKAAHPLANVLDRVTEPERAASEASRLLFKVADWGNGHREVTVATRRPNLEKTLERAIERDVSVLTPRGEGDRDSNIERAARRAKLAVRYLAKGMAVNALWTLTYRENVQDRELVLKHLDRFRRRVHAVLGEWAYIAVIERQKRGAFHIHLATHALPARIIKKGYRPVKSWDVMRHIWRDVVGALGGNFDEAKRSRWGARKHHQKAVRGCGAIASYIAGYVAKDMLESELNRKRYSASKGIAPPAIVREEYANEVGIATLIEQAYAWIGEKITRAWFNKEAGVFFLESDDSRPPA